MMKKLTFILLVFAGFFAKAQDPQSSETVQQQSYYDAKSSYFYYNGLANDTIGANDSIWDYSVRIRSRSELKVHLAFDLDSTGGTFDTTYIDLYSKTAAFNNWILRERVAWKLGSDTIGYIESDSSHISEFWKARVWSEDDSFKAKVRPLIKDENPEVQSQALSYCGWSQDKEAFSNVLDILKTSEKEKVLVGGLNCMSVIGKGKEADLTPVIAEKLKSESPRVRRASISALFHLRDCLTTDGSSVKTRVMIISETDPYSMETNKGKRYPLRDLAKELLALDSSK